MDAVEKLESLCIRDATVDDLDALAAVRGPRALHDDRVWQMLDGECRYLLASARGQIVGWEMVLFRPRSGSENAQRVPLVVDLYVAPPARSRGVGSRLIAAAERAAVERGFAAIHLTVDPV